MFNLEKIERIVIAALILSLLAGLAVLAYKKSHSGVDITVRRYADVPSGGQAMSGHYVTHSKTVNINSAGPGELMKVRGIGRVLAGRIVEYRSKKSLFLSVEDIKNVKGIGPKLFDKIKDHLTVE